MSLAIRVENLGKKYLLRHQVGRSRHRYVALRDVLAYKIKSLFQSRGADGDQSREEFWALKNVSFEIQQGDAVGIIGRNGAGKSTLLKLLSRITEPSEGQIELEGRMASLLEVGTGFHPELTARENIYLNGAIMGMTRAEIKRKFDEIVAFAEVEKFLDTPVKHFSSGMYMRLAFAVAAHLEPEILIVDEVLAVGDMQFQKKCLGKMQDVATGGRTVLFVSHNMSAVQKLCQRCVLLKGGEITRQGPADEVIKYYLSNTGNDTGAGDFGRLIHTAPELTITDVRLYKNGERSERFNFGDDLRIEVLIQARQAFRVSVEIVLRDGSEVPLAFLGTGMTLGKEFMLEPGENWVGLDIPRLPLAEGKYFLDVAVGLTGVRFLEYRESCRSFTVEISDPAGSGNPYIQKDKGSMYLPFTCSSSARIVS